MSDPIIELRGISKRFGPTLDAAARLTRGIKARFGTPERNQIVHAVDNVSLTVNRGEVVGLVGESGCGKSTIGRMVAGIMPPTEGQVLFKGNEITAMSSEQAKDAKLKVQMIFQDPYASLNPRMRVAEIVGEAPRYHGMIKGDFDEYLDAQLRRAGLDYHEFTAVQRHADWAALQAAQQAAGGRLWAFSTRGTKMLGEVAWQQGDWLVAELVFAQLNPAVVVLQAVPEGIRLPERAVWSGSTSPWQPGPRIRQHLELQVPQVPAALLACYDPVTPGLR